MSIPMLQLSYQTRLEQGIYPNKVPRQMTDFVSNVKDQYQKYSFASL